MLKFFVIAATLVAAQISFARTCTSADGRFEVSVSGNEYYKMQTALKIDGQDIASLTEFCTWTPSIRSVLRCPHRLTEGLHAEVYPRFPIKGAQPGDDALKRRSRPWDLTQPVIDVKIVIRGQDTVALDCQD